MPVYVLGADKEASCTCANHASGVRAGTPRRAPLLHIEGELAGFSSKSSPTLRTERAPASVRCRRCARHA